MTYNMSSDLASPYNKQNRKSSERNRKRHMLLSVAEKMLTTTRSSEHGGWVSKVAQLPSETHLGNLRKYDVYSSRCYISVVCKSKCSLPICSVRPRINLTFTVI